MLCARWYLYQSADGLYQLSAKNYRGSIYKPKHGYRNINIKSGEEMTKAEEAALKAYPDVLFPFTPLDLNAYRRGAFINGYEAAEKDLALTWEDIRKIVVLFSEVSFECFDTKSANEMCEETLTRFKQYKEASHD